MRKLLLFSGVALVLASFNAQASGDPAAGKAKYDTLCVTCHGPAGAGDGAASAALTPKPRNFTDAAFQTSKTDDQLKKVISEGGAPNGLSASMPAWGPMLTPVDIDNVVAFIRTLKK